MEISQEALSTIASANNRDLPPQAIPLVKGMRLLSLSVGDTIILPSTRDPNGSHGWVRVLHIKSVGSPENFTVVGGDKTYITGSTLEDDDDTYVQVDGIWVDAEVQNDKIAYPSPDETHRWHTEPNGDYTYFRVSDGLLSANAVFDVRDDVNAEFQAHLDGPNRPRQEVFGLHYEIAEHAAKFRVPDHAVLDTRESINVIRARIDSISEMEFMQLVSKTGTRHTLRDKNQVLLEMRRLVDYIGKQYGTFTNYLRLREVNPYLIENVPNLHSGTKYIFDEFVHGVDRAVRRMAPAGHFFSILNPEVLDEDATDILHSVMAKYGLETYDLSNHAAAELFEQIEPEQSQRLTSLSNYGSFTSEEIKDRISPIEHFLGLTGNPSDVAVMLASTGAESRWERHQIKASSNAESALRRSRNRGDKVSGPGLAPPTPAAMVESIANKTLDGEYRVGGGFKAVLDRTYDIRANLIITQDGTQKVRVPVRQLDLASTQPEVYVDGQRMSVVEYLKRNHQQATAETETVDGLSLPRRLIAGLPGRKETGDAAHIIDPKVLLFQLGFTADHGNLSEAANATSEIEHLNTLLANAGFSARRFKYYADMRDYQAQLSRAKTGPKSVHAARLEAFVNKLSETYYKGQRFDPRAVVAHHRNLHYKVIGEVYSAAYRQDAKNVRMGSFGEEVEEHITEENTKFGRYRDSLYEEAHEGIVASYLRDAAQGNMEAIKAVQRVASNSADIDAFYRGVVGLAVTPENMIGPRMPQTLSELSTRGRDGELLDPLDVINRVHGGEVRPTAVSVEDYLTMSNSLVQSKRELAGELRTRKRQGAPSEELDRLRAHQNNLVPDNLEAWRELSPQEDFASVREHLNQIANITSRGLIFQDQIKELEAEINRLRATGGSPNGITRKQAQIAELQARLGHEDRNVQRRLYGVVMGTGGPQLGSPEIFENALRDRTDVHFFGTNATDFDFVLGGAQGHDPARLLETGRELGLRWAMQAETQSEAYWWRGGTRRLSEQLQATLPEWARGGLGLSPAEVDLVTEMHQTGRLRHLAFNQSGTPRSGFRSEADPLPIQTIQDVPTTPQAIAEASRAVFSKVMVDKDFRKELQDQMQRDKAWFLGADSRQGHLFRMQGETAVFDDSTKYVLGNEGVGPVLITIPQFYEHVGDVNLRKNKPRQTEVIAPNDPEMEVFRLRGVNFDRFLVHNNANPILGESAIQRAVDYYKNPVNDLVYLDTETTLEKGIRSVSVLKKNAAHQEVFAREYFTEAFYTQQVKKFLEGRKHEEIQLGESLSKEDFWEKYGAKNGDTQPPSVGINTKRFLFDPRNIRTEEEQILLLHRHMRDIVRDNSLVVAQNASFDADVVIGSARRLAKTSSRSYELTVAAQYFEATFNARLTDIATIVQLAYPGRSGTGLEVVAKSFLPDFDQEQTHTALDDNRVAAQVVEQGIDKGEHIPEGAELMRQETAGVLTFADKAKAPILVDKILPIDERSGRQGVQVMGRQLNIEALKRGEIQVEHEDSRLLHTYPTGYSFELKLQQQRHFLLTEAEAKTRGVELMAMTESSVYDDAFRNIRRAISGHESDAPQERAFTVLRGKIAAAYNQVPVEDRESFKFQVLAAAANKETLDLPGRQPISFAGFPEKTTTDLVRWMRPDPEGTIEDPFFRQALIQAAGTLEKRANSGDAAFLQRVQPLYESGLLALEHYKAAARGYQYIVDQVAPLPDFQPKAWNGEDPRRITLASLRDDGTMIKQKISLNVPNADNVESNLREHLGRLGIEDNDLNDSNVERSAVQRLWNDLGQSGVRLRGVVHTVNGLANLITHTAENNPEFGFAEVAARNYFSVPDVAVSTQVEQVAARALRMNREDMTDAQFATSLQNIAATIPQPEQHHIVGPTWERVKSDAASAETSSPESGAWDTPENVRQSPSNYQEFERDITAPLPDLGAGVQNTLRDAFTHVATAVSQVSAETISGVAIGGVALAAFLATATAGANDERSGGAATGPSDAPPITSQEANRTMTADLRHGTGQEEANAGYRKLNVTIHGTFPGVGGNRLSHEALDAISSDITRELSNHLQADIDEANSSRQHRQQNNDNETRWGVSTLMSRIASRGH